VGFERSYDMRRETNASHAALRLCGCNPAATSSQRAQTIFRTALKAGDTSIFDTFHMAYTITVPTVAAMEIASLFTGKHGTTWKYTEDPVPFEGFFRAYGQGSDPALFHADSVDHEDASTAYFEQGELVWGAMVEAGVNPLQAMAMRSMQAPAQITISGTLMDFYRFWRTAGPVTYNRHPDTRNLAIDIWTEIEFSDRDFVAAAREVGPTA
jgi:hypothetical protein